MTYSMTSRRRFLAASTLSLFAAMGTSSLASARGRGAAGAPAAIAETFAPAEWVEAFAALAASGGHAGDRAFWRSLEAGQLEDAPGRDQPHLLALRAPGVEAFAPDLARRLARVSNDRLAQQVRAGRGAIGGLAAVSAFDPDAAQEARRAVGVLGLAGISLGANRGMRLDDPSLRPLFAFAEAAHAPIYLPTAYSADAAYAALGRDGVLAGASADSSAHAAQLIFGGVLDSYPGLTVVLGRLGDAAPYWIGELAAVEANLVEAGAQRPRRSVGEYFERNIHLTTAGMESGLTAQFCREALGGRRLVRARGASLEA